jgi:hypothetical protein
MPLPASRRPLIDLLTFEAEHAKAPDADVEERDRSFAYQAYIDRLRVGTELERG